MSFTFTLIELLVVVTIIAILASLLLPALTSARSASQSTLCKANLKQIHLAMISYCDDGDDYTPAPIYWWRALGYASRYQTAGAGQGYVGAPTAMFGPNTTDWGWAASYRRWPTFSCPGEPGLFIANSGADTAVEKVSTMFDNDLQNNSYDYNWYLNHGNYYVTNRTRRFSRTPDIRGGFEAAPLFLDCQGYTSVGWHWNYREWNINNMSNPWLLNALYAFRHPGERANVVMMDGHVETYQHRIKTGVSIDLAIYTAAP